MKVAVLDVSHWHAELAMVGLERADCEVVAVSSVDAAAAAPWVARFGCRVYPATELLLDSEHVDFVFVFGSHRLLPIAARQVLERKIACSIEKPGGVRAADVEALEGLSQRLGVFASVPFVNRLGPLTQRLREETRSGRWPDLSHLSFVDIAGSPQRYVEAGCGWMLDPAQSGGGCLINLGVHFIDLFAYLTGRRARLAGVALSHAIHGSPIEDHARVLLANDQGHTCLVEVGYTFPNDEERHQAFTFVGRGWFADDVDGRARLIHSGGAFPFDAPIDAGPFYADYVIATLRAVERGEKPVAGLDDLAAVMRIVDAAYAKAQSTSGREEQ